MSITSILNLTAPISHRGRLRLAVTLRSCPRTIDELENILGCRRSRIYGWIRDLRKAKLLQYDKASGKFRLTELGIAWISYLKDVESLLKNEEFLNKSAIERIPDEFIGLLIRSLGRGVVLRGPAIMGKAEEMVENARESMYVVTDDTGGLRLGKLILKILKKMRNLNTSRFLSILVNQQLGMRL